MSLSWRILNSLWALNCNRLSYPTASAAPRISNATQSIYWYLRSSIIITVGVRLSFKTPFRQESALRFLLLGFCCQSNSSARRPERLWGPQSWGVVWSSRWGIERVNSPAKWVKGIHRALQRPLEIQLINIADGFIIAWAWGLGAIIDLVGERYWA